MQQFALLQIIQYIPQGVHHDAVALQRPQFDDFAVVRRQVRAQFDGVFFVAVFQLPRAQRIVGFLDEQTLVVVQIVQALRHTFALYVTGRRAQDAYARSQSSGDDIGV